MDRDFERFQGGPTEAAGMRYYVTINRGNLIRLNRKMYLDLGKPNAVYLNYSRTRDLIAIEPAEARFSQAFPVLPERAGWRIMAAPFCRHFGIGIESTVKFVRPEIVSGVLHLKLSETVSVREERGNRGSR